MVAVLIDSAWLVKAATISDGVIGNVVPVIVAIRFAKLLRI